MDPQENGRAHPQVAGSPSSAVEEIPWVEAIASVDPMDEVYDW